MSSSKTVAYSDCLKRLVTTSQSVLTTSNNARISAALHHSGMPSTSASSVAYSFPLPPSLVSDFLALGCNTLIAQRLSQSYTDVDFSLKTKYETEFYQADRTCNQLLLLVHGSTVHKFQDRMRSLYVSHYTTLMYSWAGEAVSMTRHRLMQATVSDSCLKLSFPAYLSSSLVDDHDIKHHSEIIHRVKAADDEVMVQPVSSQFLDLKSLFRRENESIKPGGDILHQNLSVSAFPKNYPCPHPAKRDPCLKILSRGFRQVMRQSDQGASVDDLIETFKDFSTSECLKSDPLNDESVTASFASSSTPPSSPPPSSTSSSVFSRITYNLPTTSLSHRVPDPKLATSPMSLQPKPRCRKSAALPKRNQVPIIPSVNYPSNIVPPASSNAPASTIVETATPASPIPAKQRHCDPLAIAISPVSSPRARKMAALPRHTMKSTTSSIASPTYPPITLSAPLSVANVSSLSQASPTLNRSRSIISRTPSLVSLTSSDLGSSSPSSDGPETPPSTPPPFTTKFPSPDPSSSLSSKSFAPTRGSRASPMSTFQLSSTRKPEKFETPSPSGRTPLFPFSTGIKREEDLFSFTFSQ
uniref:B2 mating type protein n=1 Tax=Heterobasidion irregulare TaxID=984962 RepID=S5RTI4_9AGAM|nr:b2 mating type protein [Heterobasidion irregulare]